MTRRPPQFDDAPAPVRTWHARSLSDRHRRRLAEAPTGSGLPPLLVLPAVGALLFLTVPLLGLVVRAPWRTMATELGQQNVVDALRLSLLSAGLATVTCLVLGLPLAWLLARWTFRGSRLLRALVTVPLVLPPVVGGVALFQVLGRKGVVGRYLDEWFGLTLPFSTAAVVIAEAFVAMPFLVIAVEGAVRATDRRFEEAAATLGASRWLILRRVTFPAVAPGVAAGTVLCFARALGEFGATITFAGSFPGRTQTMPIEIYLALDSDPEAAIALSLLLLVVSMAVLVGLRGRWLPGRV